MGLLARVAACLLMVAPATAAGTSLIMRASVRSRTRMGLFAGLRYSAQDPAAQTLITLDTNKDGRIDPEEISAFAQLQGLDATAATQEFSGIDANHDGVLDSDELKQVLGAAAPAAAAAVEQATSVQPPNVAVLGPGNVAVLNPGNVAALGPGNVAALGPGNVAALGPGNVAALGPGNVAALGPGNVGVLNPGNVGALNPGNIAALALGDVSALASENVAANAAMSSLAEEPRQTRTELLSEDSEKSDLISHESRESMRIAAQQVSEELQHEETEENAARNLDRQANQLHAKSAALVKQAVHNAQDAGAKAAHTKTDEILAKITTLEDQAEQAEVRAAALHAKSKMEAEEAAGLMSVVDQAMKQ